MFSYREVLKKAFDVVLRHKTLWFFGLFATFLAGSGQYNLAFGKINQALSQGSFFINLAKIFESGLFGPNVLINFSVAFQEDPMAAFSALVFLLSLLVLFCFFVWLVVASEIALINNSALIIKKDKKTTIKDGVEAGLENFWPVLGITLIGKSFIFFLVLFIGLPLFFITPHAGLALNILYGFLFLIFLPVALIIDFIVRYACAYVVIKKEKFIDAIESAWSLFLKNWLSSLEIAFIILFIHFIVSLLALILVLVLAIPFVFFSYILASALGIVVAEFITFTLLMAVGIVLATFLVIIIGAGMTAFKTTAWTNIFLELDSKKITLSKLIRIFG